ncbi:GNAT family N-acetyltransferase [Deinococcus sonorensis]|uniref:GNAT family N-acetyltransferase n=2 Tax=Deinococcus sonorensis TaxID=309891 RepID=A0AAU7UD80_9DEIO
MNDKVLRWLKLTPQVLSALLDHDLEAASALLGVPLGPFFLTEEALWLWRYRLDQMRRDPASAAWVARAVAAEPAGVVVGYAGFHGPPDEAGMVEVGYSVDPAHRRQGYATAMLRDLLEEAGSHAGVQTVRATIRPDNSASLATIRPFGFREVGEQWDEIDGLELIFERPARTPLDR